MVRLCGWLHDEASVGLQELVSQLSAPFLRPGALPPRVDSKQALDMVSSLLRRLKDNGKAALFVLEEFDLFAPQRGNQLLLYTLLDAMQSTQCRCSLLGLSVRADATELLEKRVRSRFSHRILPFGTQPLADGAAMLGQLLLLPPPPSFAHAPFAAQWNAALERALRPGGALACAAPRALLGQHRHPRALAAAALHMLAALPAGAQALGEEEMAYALQAAAECGRAGSLRGCSPTGLHLLVAAVRLRGLRGRAVFTFGALFSEYAAAIRTLDAGRVAGREVALHAFEALRQLNAFEPADSAALGAAGAGRAGWLRDHVGYALSLSDDVVRAAVLATHPRLTNLEHLLMHESAGAYGAPAL